MNASITSAYRSTAKINVTFTLMPAASVAVIAGSPSRVAGILIITFGRASRSHNSCACAIVPSVSWARSGDTSTDTNPSAPSSWS